MNELRVNKLKKYIFSNNNNTYKLWHLTCIRFVVGLLCCVMVWYGIDIGRYYILIFYVILMYVYFHLYCMYMFGLLLFLFHRNFSSMNKKKECICFFCYRLKRFKIIFSADDVRKCFVLSVSVCHYFSMCLLILRIENIWNEQISFRF